MLYLLYKKVIENKGRTIMEESLAVSTSDIADELKVSVEKVQLLACSLADGEVKFEDYGKGEVLIAQKDTVTSYASKKYLKSGKDFVLGRIKDYLTVTVSTIAIITAIVSVTTSLISIADNRKEIKLLKTRLDAVESQRHIKPDTGKSQK